MPQLLAILIEQVTRGALCSWITWSAVCAACYRMQLGALEGRCAGILVDHVPVAIAT